MHKRNGFTIVELLIVVVVIAILAAITIVSYNGISQRAYNSRVVSGVEQYYKAIELYRTLNGRYPMTTDEKTGGIAVTLTCLGSGYKDKECGTVTGKVISEDALFNLEMKTVISGNPPAIGLNAIQVQGESFTGAVYGGDVTGCDKSSTCYARTIQYALQGVNQNCVISGAYAYNTSSGTTACEIILEVLQQP